MASAESSQDMLRGRDCHPQPLGNVQPRHRSTSRQLSDQQRPIKAVVCKCDRCPGALHAGDAVHVFSRCADKWIDGEVVKFEDGSFVRVEYEVEGYWCGKTLHLHSEHLSIPSQVFTNDSSSDPSECDPGNFYYPSEAKLALADFSITLESGKRGSVLKILDIDRNPDYEQHHAFTCTFRGRPLQGFIEMEYSPQMHTQTGNVDVVLKVHARSIGDPDDKFHYKEVKPGFVHTLLHKPNEKVRFKPTCRAYVLGLTVHKDLSKDLRDKMNANATDKVYIQGLIDRFKVTWKEREEACGETVAGDADYIISYCGANRHDNNELLRRLATQGCCGPHDGPLRFCTDRSLGFGVHYFDHRAGDSATLSLGKHGFAQPIAGNGWWDEYRNAVDKTKYGILALNPSREYFSSEACVKEWQIPGLVSLHKDKCRLWVYCREKKDIITAISYCQRWKIDPPQPFVDAKSIGVVMRQKISAGGDPTGLLLDLVDTVDLSMDEISKVEHLVERVTQAYKDSIVPEACLEALRTLDKKLQQRLDCDLSKQKTLKKRLNRCARDIATFFGEVHA